MTARFAENQAVLKALGLDHLKRVAAINIKLRVGHLPSVVIWQWLDEFGQDEPTPQRFRLVPEPEQGGPPEVAPPFGITGASIGWMHTGMVGGVLFKPKPLDLDRMCAEAVERLREGVAQHVAEQHVEWGKACVDRAYRAAIREALEKSLGNLLKEMMTTTSRQGGPIL